MVGGHAAVAAGECEWEDAESLLPSVGKGGTQRRLQDHFPVYLRPSARLLLAALLIAAAVLHWTRQPLPGRQKVQDIGHTVVEVSTRPVVTSSKCNATSPRDEDFLQRFVPCGTLVQECGDLPIILANTDYPGSGATGDVEHRDYIVQFDTGLHPHVARAAFQARFAVGACVNCTDDFTGFGEVCLEVVVRGHDNWGSLGGDVPGLSEKAYDCMGRCGAGCMGRPSGALDCLKHDVCSAWKSKRRQRRVAGYCHDPDCGDEGAQALYNCYSWRGAAVCNQTDPMVKGSWSPARWYGMGWCSLYQGWERGQGIPSDGSWTR